MVALAVVVLTVLATVRSVAVSSVSAHMAAMTSGFREHLDLALHDAVRLGINEGLVAGLLAALFVASLASLAIAGLLTRPVKSAAEAAERIAGGDYSGRLDYKGKDEVGQFARSFNHMAAKLEETEELRRQLLATISHELRTPLSNIQGYMEGLVEGVIPPEERTFELVHDEALRLARLVGDIERLSRLESGAEHVECGAVDPAAAAEKVVEAMRPAFDRDGIALSVEKLAGGTQVWADQDKLAQILVNLLSNARAHTPSGGAVSVRLVPDAEGVLFQVTDNGSGIPGKDLPRIFERFYRVDKSRTRATGTGIGLSVVKALVELMGGRVWAESEPGAGTTVSFTLEKA